MKTVAYTSDKSHFYTWLLLCMSPNLYNTHPVLRQNANSTSNKGYIGLTSPAIIQLIALLTQSVRELHIDTGYDW